VIVRFRSVFLCALLAVAAVSGAAQPEKPVAIADWFAQLQRPGSPNHWLAAPADFVVKPDAVAPVYALPVARLREAFVAMLRTQPRMAIVGGNGDGLHAVATTAVLRFDDDIRVQFIALSPAQSTLAIYSASRVGYWDLGANRRRVEDLLGRLQAPVAAP
jgi:uncharacterized protein (DUF1499 family)